MPLILLLLFAPVSKNRLKQHRTCRIIKSAMPAKALREKQHPAKRSFQAIRIAVNDELGAVREAMQKAIDSLNQMDDLR